MSCYRLIIAIQLQLWKRFKKTAKYIILYRYGTAISRFDSFNKH